MGRTAFWAAIVGASFALFTAVAPPEWFGSGNVRGKIATVAFALMVIGAVGWIASYVHESHEREHASRTALLALVRPPSPRGEPTSRLHTSERLLSSRELNERVIHDAMTNEQEHDTTARAVDLDSLPVNDQLSITSIRYGEGIQVVSVSKERLVTLGPEVLLGSCREWVSFDNGERYVLKKLFTTAESAGLQANPYACFPRDIVVAAVKVDESHWLSLMRVCDIPYLEAVEYAATRSVEMQCVNGRGGIACFIDRQGNYQSWNPYIIGNESNGIGGLSVLALVEWDGDRPLYRSQYVVILRKGIRYPEDIWRSKVTGQPILSPGIGDITQKRFIFQSREPRGNSSDVFVADFAGSNMFNLSESHVDAYDGLDNDEGEEIARWIDDRRIAYCSMIDGSKRTVVGADPLLVDRTRQSPSKKSLKNA